MKSKREIKLLQVNVLDKIRIHGKSDFDLNRVMIINRKIKNPTRACTLMNLIMRFLDADKVSGKRWFFRPVQAFYTGHKGHFRAKRE